VRKTIIATGEIYHLFNRGIEKRTIFSDKRDYNRAMQTLDFYRFFGAIPPFSEFLRMEKEKRDYFISQLKISGEKLVEILCFCLMPNHFHLLIKQLQDDGIKIFMSNFCNSYTKYFNLKKERVGPLLQGGYKSVLIEDNNQLIHVSRYIHINPAVSFIVKNENLINYPYSSLPEYLGNRVGFCNTSEIMSSFSSIQDFKSFTFDQIDYGKRLDSVKHLLME